MEATLFSPSGLAKAATLERKRGEGVAEYLARVTHLHLSSRQVTSIPQDASEQVCTLLASLPT